MQPLVLAIEPDLRQAAIVKRIVREKVLADVTVVDSRDAALEAMRKTVPDVLLLSALLSPRDEDELIAHLRTLQHAEHLQTHTIPQLSSTIGQGDDDKPARGLLSAFRRRKGSASVPSGCDPDLFAEEIRTYLQRASEKKRELRDNPARETAMPATPSAGAVPSARDDGHDAETAAPESSWASPFEWRPSRDVSSAKKTAAPSRETAAAAPRSVVADPEPVVPAVEPVVPIVDPVVASADPVVSSAESVVATPDPVVASADPVLASAEPVLASVEPESAPDADTIVVAAPQSVLIPQPRSVLLPRSEAPAKEEPPVARRKLPLSKRHAREWWFEGEEPKDTTSTKTTDSEMREVLASLSVPLQVAAIGYAEGCRIRRVRLAAE
jgi:hypothetical protein